MNPDQNWIEKMHVDKVIIIIRIEQLVAHEKRRKRTLCLLIIYYLQHIQCSDDRSDVQRKCNSDKNMQDFNITNLNVPLITGFGKVAKNR